MTLLGPIKYKVETYHHAHWNYVGVFWYRWVATLVAGWINLRGGQAVVLEIV
jgi:hypothetical protein